jgi:hypothetical protein
MITMRHTVLLAVALLTTSLTAAAAPVATRTHANPLLEDVVQMSRAGLSDTTIIAYLRARATRLDADVSADDLIRLERAGVSQKVIEYVAGAAGVESARTRVGDDQRITPDEAEETEAVPESSDEDVSYAAPDGYAYSGWYGYGYPYWYAYSPFFAGGIVIRGGGGFFRGRRFSSRPFRSGGFTGRGRSFGGHAVGGHGRR